MNCRALLAVVLTVWSAAAYSQAVCPRFREADGSCDISAWSNSITEAGQACVTARNTGTVTGGGSTGYTTVYTLNGCDGGPYTGSGTKECQVQFQRSPVSPAACFPGGEVNCAMFDGSPIGIAYEVNPDGCPDTECDPEAPGAGETFTSSNVEGPNTYCNPVSGCKMTVKNRTGGTMTIQHTLQNCNGDTDPPDDSMPNEGDGETCAAVGDGEYCASAQGDGECGYINDTYTCLSKVKSDECKVLGDGGRVCGNQASSTPPVPDNGTPGQLATPDAVITQTNPDGSTTFNYFNSTTVLGSSRDPGTTGASGASSSGSPHAPVPGEGDGEGEGLPEECEGAGCTAEVPALEDIGTLEDAFAGFWSDLEGVPVIAAAADIAPSFGGGSCPDWSTEVALYSASIDIDFSSMCGIWTDISPALGAVCLVMFGLLAFRILFSA